MRAFSPRAASAFDVGAYRAFLDQIDELDRSALTEIFPGVQVPIVSRTDAAVSKLIWVRHGSHRSRRDLRRIVAGANPQEVGVVRQTAGEMGLEDLLDEVLEGLDAEDAGFAEEVRRAIFTFANIPARIDPRNPTR